jgi:hypothetical protein
MEVGIAESRTWALTTCSAIAAAAPATVPAHGKRDLVDPAVAIQDKPPVLDEPAYVLPTRERAGVQDEPCKARVVSEPAVHDRGKGFDVLDA